MSPAIGAGDVVIVKDVQPQQLGEGDVITFRSGGQGAGPGRVTHRVVEVVQQDGERQFRTKGDANEEADRELVASDDIIGRVMFSIPLLGHLISFAGSDMGIIALVIVPSVLLILNEGWRLYRGLAGSAEETSDSE
jgi:signal peptidase